MVTTIRVINFSKAASLPSRWRATDYTDYAKVQVLEYGANLKIRWTIYRKKKEAKSGPIRIFRRPGGSPLSIEKKSVGLTGKDVSILGLPFGEDTLSLKVSSFRVLSSRRV
jgi:hypothetical protein